MKRFLLAMAVLAFGVNGHAQAQSFFSPNTFLPITHGKAYPFDDTSRSLTNAFIPYARWVRLHPTEDAFISFGTTSTGLVADSATGTFLPADTTQIFKLNSRYMAIIRATTSGTIYVTEVGR